MGDNPDGPAEDLADLLALLRPGTDCDPTRAAEAAKAAPGDKGQAARAPAGLQSPSARKSKPKRKRGGRVAGLKRVIASRKPADILPAARRNSSKGLSTSALRDTLLQARKLGQKLLAVVERAEALLEEASGSVAASTTQAAPPHQAAGEKGAAPGRCPAQVPPATSNPTQPAVPLAGAAVPAAAAADKALAIVPRRSRSEDTRQHAAQEAQQEQAQEGRKAEGSQPKQVAKSRQPAQRAAHSTPRPSWMNQLATVASPPPRLPGPMHHPASVRQQAWLSCQLPHMADPYGSPFTPLPPVPCRPLYSYSQSPPLLRPRSFPATAIAAPPFFPASYPAAMHVSTSQTWMRSPPPPPLPPSFDDW